MADLLIRHLKKKGAEHSALELLVNQWGFDEQLIPKALQTIGHLFPHYSRHDESHSKQILINIERLLGENIELLTATDTWLLLEAAYWHDIGMVVPQNDIRNALENPDFLQYVEAIRNSPSHELYRFCNSFQNGDLSKCFNDMDSPLEALDKFRQLMAEWFRRQHASRAETIVQTPWDGAGIKSPRTELIPARLFKLLGRICYMHGVPFDILLGKSGLPFREAGLAQEDCHPRFVACLLRMGDLLDLDDNRFCPVMQKIAGEERPALSKAHEDKHAGMRHLRIDREYIEIAAECETIDGYLEAFKWFDWLKQEMQDQMANWQSIVPNRELGLLPTLGPISVKLSGKLQVLNEGQRPQFTVDLNNAKELLQGSNLYKNEYACIRELLQNSVDATLLRVWLQRDENSKEPWDNPDIPLVIDTLRSAAVEVNIVETEVKSGASIWTITISDQGTGISREDLNFMLRIGGSQKNERRQQHIGSMPEWMKPSGVFGIGFQSVFLICDEVTLITKSVFTNETLKVKMHSPTKSKEGLVLLEKLENKISQPCGTTLQMNVLLDYSNRNFSFSEDSDVSIRLLGESDPVLDDRFPYKAAKLAERISDFSKNCLLPIRALIRTKDNSSDVEIATSEKSNSGDSGWRFLKIRNHQLKIRYCPNPDIIYSDEFYSFYRGQPFSAVDLDLPYVKVEVDLMSGKAGSWLNASRDTLAQKAVAEFSGLVLEALEMAVDFDFSNAEWMGKLSHAERPAYSLFCAVMAQRYGGGWVGLAKKLEGEWLDLPTTASARIRDSFRKKAFVLGRSPIFYGDGPNEKCDLLVERGMITLVLNEWIKKANRTFQVVHTSEIDEDPKRAKGYELCYVLKTSSQPMWSNLAFAARLAELMDADGINRRYLLASNDQRWESLSLSQAIGVPASNVFYHLPNSSNRILLPFLFRHSSKAGGGWIAVASLDALCSWVQPRLNNPMSISQLKEKYLDLIEYIDSDIMKPSKYWDDWAVCRGI